jgi:hypothetical protein
LALRLKKHKKTLASLLTEGFFNAFFIALLAGSTNVNQPML